MSKGPPKRLGDDLTPRLISVPETYPATSDGPVRRAPLTNRDGTRLGAVWTDGRAAGWLSADKPDPATERAGAFVWVVLRDSYRRGTPASEVLDPKLYVPYRLGEPERADTPAG